MTSRLFVAGLPRATLVGLPLRVIMTPVVGPKVAPTGVAAAWDRLSMPVRLVLSCSPLEHCLSHRDPGRLKVRGLLIVHLHHPEEDLGPQWRPLNILELLRARGNLPSLRLVSHQPLPRVEGGQKFKPTRAGVSAMDSFPWGPRPSAPT